MGFLRGVRLIGDAAEGTGPLRVERRMVVMVGLVGWV